jgi:hypothetical protein
MKRLTSGGRPDAAHGPGSRQSGADQRNPIAGMPQCGIRQQRDVAAGLRSAPGIGPNLLQVQKVCMPAPQSPAADRGMGPVQRSKEQPHTGGELRCHPVSIPFFLIRPFKKGAAQMVANLPSFRSLSRPVEEGLEFVFLIRKLHGIHFLRCARHGKSDSRSEAKHAGRLQVSCTDFTCGEADCPRGTVRHETYGVFPNTAFARDVACKRLGHPTLLEMSPVARAAGTHFTGDGDADALNLGCLHFPTFADLSKKPRNLRRKGKVLEYP